LEVVNRDVGLTFELICDVVMHTAPDVNFWQVVLDWSVDSFTAGCYDELQNFRSHYIITIFLA